MSLNNDQMKNSELSSSIKDSKSSLQSPKIKDIIFSNEIIITESRECKNIIESDKNRLNNLKSISNNEVKKDNNIMEVIKDINIENNIDKNEEKSTILYDDEFREKLKTFYNISNDRLKENYEFYLISNEFFSKLKDYMEGKNDDELIKIKSKIKNDECLLDKEIINKALSLHPDDNNNMIILKPIYIFCRKLRPSIIDRDFWIFLKNYFNIEPEIKLKPEKIDIKGKTIYNKGLCRYIKISCIILPKKAKNISEEDLISNIQQFYFFINSKITINELIEHIKQLLNEYQYIDKEEKSDLKFWIDLNYFSPENLLKLIKDKIAQIYNLMGLNQFQPIYLETLENEDAHNEIKESNKFEFKLFPLNLFEKDILCDIFPNQITNNFNSINQILVYEKNRDIENIPNPEKDEILSKFPELTIIIEPKKNTIFFKDDTKLNYRIGKCCYNYCKNKGILPIYCECLKKFYCSAGCKEKDKQYHDEDCLYSLGKKFKELSLHLSKPFTSESLVGKTGIRNIGNTCYMNTALQCLSNCIELRNYFIFQFKEKEINKDNILGYKGVCAYGFDYLIKQLWIDKNPVIDISNFKKAVGLCNERFAGRSQQDTHEFVTFLIDSLHEDLNRVENKTYISKEERELDDETKSKIEWNNYLKRNQSILVDLFYGLFKSTVVCSVCNKSYVDFSVFSSIPLNIKHNTQRQKDEEKNNKNEEDNELNINNEKENIKINNEEIIHLTDDEENNKENKDNKKNDLSNTNLNFQINNEIRNNSEDLKTIEASKIKEEILAGGKSTDNNINTKIEIKKDDEFFTQLLVISYFYSFSDKPLQFRLQINDKSELTHNILLYKLSHLLNKDPSSLCLYHVSNDEKEGIIHIYGKNNFNKYDKDKVGKNILFISEINLEIIKGNLSELTNPIFFDSKNSSYIFDKSKSSRENLKDNLIKNKENIRKCLTNIITENDIKNENYNEKLILNHSMNLNKVFQFTLQNNINEKDNIKRIFYPKIIFFSKTKTVYDLYYEIFKMGKIIFDIETNVEKKIKDYFENLFGFINKNSDDSNNNNKERKNPFYLVFKILNHSELKLENEKILNCTEKEKEQKLEDIIKEIMDITELNNKQIILEIYWDEIYNKKLTEILKPDKVDSLIEKTLEISKKQNHQESNHSYKIQYPLNQIDTAEIIKQKRLEKFCGQNKQFTPLNVVDIRGKENSNKISNCFTSLNPIEICKKEEEIKEINLMETFEILREEELLDENNEWFCQNCDKKQRVKKKIEIYNAPKILILQIKRFNHLSKINTKVDYPLTDLDISEYVISKNKDITLKYDLFAVANHYGSLSFGHYTAFCKNSIDGKWYEFNDSLVNQITDLSKIISSNAYVLYYRQQGLNKLDWNEIYRKTFNEIDINNPEKIIDFNYDFNNYYCAFKKGDINDFDKKILNKTKKNDENKNNENLININNNDVNGMNIEEEENKIKEKNDFLNKKRASYRDIGIDKQLL